MSSPVFNFLRRRKSPLSGAYFAPSGLSDSELICVLSFAASDLISTHYAITGERNASSLIRKIKLLSFIFDSIEEAIISLQFSLSPSAVLCLKEFYIVVHRARALLDHCAQSSRTLAVLRIPTTAGNFHDLSLEIATLLDVFPINNLNVSTDAMEFFDLLRRHCRRSKLYIDPSQDSSRRKIFDFLAQFESGSRPDSESLRDVFVGRLGFRSSDIFAEEIEFLEEMLRSQEDDADPSLLGGTVALLRYSRFLLFGFVYRNVNELPERFSLSAKKLRRGGVERNSLSAPKEFCCPISLDLMRDPVIVSTGQTYDRASITKWMDEGHSTCPNSAQTLSHNRLVPNRALRSLISQWCAAHGIPYDPLDGDNFAEGLAMVSTTKAAIEANKATAELLVRQLCTESDEGNAAAACELRLLAKTGKENRACIAEAGAIPHLRRLLDSQNPVAQENSVTALLNLSIHDLNKSRIMEEEGCLRSTVNVLQNGWTTEARENAAATLFSLSAVHDYKKRILDESNAVEGLAGLLKEGTPRGKKDAVTALFNISTHSDCSERMVESGAMSALVGALSEEGVAEDAAGALALLMRRPNVAQLVAKEDNAVAGLVGLMRRGSPRGKENAVAALQEMCRTGGAPLTLRVVKTPGLNGVIQSILFTGTKRARRKAASLVRMCQRCEQPVAFGLEHALARSGSLRRRPSFGSGDVSVSVTMAISVPVL